MKPEVFEHRGIAARIRKAGRTAAPASERRIGRGKAAAGGAKTSKQDHYDLCMAYGVQGRRTDVPCRGQWRWRLVTGRQTGRNQMTAPYAWSVHGMFETSVH